LATQLVLNSISDAYMIISDNDLVISYNKPFADIFTTRYGLTEGSRLNDFEVKDGDSAGSVIYNLISAVESGRSALSTISYEQPIIIRDGKINQKELALLRYSVDDLMEQLRVCGVFDLQDVDMAVVETTGQLSVSKKTALQPPTVTDMGIHKSPAAIPAVVVSDGEIVKQGLQLCGIDQKKLQKLIKQEKTALQDIFLMTCTTDMTVFIVPKDKGASR
jgi:uncharacterized membrane protein YcaP (DUF421 family)